MTISIGRGVRWRGGSANRKIKPYRNTPKKPPKKIYDFFPDAETARMKTAVSKTCKLI